MVPTLSWQPPPDPRRALAGRDVEVQQVRQRVEVVHRQSALTRHEPAQGRFADAEFLGDAIAALAGGIDRLPYLLTQLDALLAHE
jgi:hypothetical protein